MSATTWPDLTDELDRWSEAGQPARFWWRDDDAVEPTPALERLLDISARFAAPVALSVIPAKTGPALAERLGQAPTAYVLQHGYAHVNHAPAGEGAAEFGPHRSLERRLAEIGEGWRKLAPFRARMPIFVPPWNRYDEAMLPQLGALGFKAVSAFGARRDAPAAAKLLEVNCHCDIIAWRSTRGFVGEGKALTKLVNHLRDSRMGGALSGAPAGLLTHHLQHDEACWGFVEELLHRLKGHEAARWITPYEALPA